MLWGETVVLAFGLTLNFAEMSTHPSISMMRLSWLYSEVPGKRGKPRKSSTQMQPKDHMSMPELYGRPKSTCCRMF